MRGRLSGMKNCSRNNAENKCGGNSQQQSGADSDADNGFGWSGLVGRWTLRADEGQTQVISRS